MKPIKLTESERQNILNQHKTVYDGYVTNNITSSEQPLYVQDFANDKGGITVNNKGEVKPYTNVGINENIDEMELDMIGDGPMDLESGVFDEEMTEEDDTEIDLKKKKPSYNIDIEFTDELDEEDGEMVKENIKESLDWFKRFTKYN